MRLLSATKKAACLDNLGDFLQHVTECAQGQGIRGKRLLEIELAMEEALVNVFNYAYPDGNGEVEVACCVDDNSDLLITITDSGVPFDLLSLADPDLSGDIENREPGGLGIFLIKKVMDHVYYKRISDKNILHLIVHRN